MDSALVSFEIYRARYYDSDLEGTSILKLFQNSNKIFHTFQTNIVTIKTDDSILTNLDDQVNCYIEICTLSDSLFSISRIPCGKIDHNKLNDQKKVISLCLIKWRNLRFLMKMIKRYMESKIIWLNKLRNLTEVAVP